MTKPKTNILKTTNNNQNNSGAKDTTQEKVSAIVSFFRLLQVDCSDFNSKQAFDSLKEYISKYGRILYAPISNEIYNCYDENNYDDAMRIIGSVITNVEKLVAYTESPEFQTRRNQTKKPESIQCLEDAQKAVLKIWDHVNLAQQQYNALKQSDDEYKEKFEKLISSYKEDMTKDVNNQLLTMVSIFTALAFLVFGGISSLDNIFSVHGVPLLKLMCVGAVWGLCILNLIFVFLFCVGKMTKLNFRSSDDPEATIFQKYPVIWWTDLMLMSILLLCLWGYYIQQYEIADWLICICLANQKSATLAGFGVIALIILGACFWLAKRTSVRKK